MSDSQAKFVSFVQERSHDVAIDSENLYSVRAHLFYLSHTCSSFVGVARRWRIAKHRIDQQPRRGYFAPGALVAQRQGLLCIASNIANRSDAAREPQLQTVIYRLGDSAALVL